MGSIPVMLEHLKSSLHEFMGQAITPEIAARLYAAAVHVPGSDRWITDRVLFAQSTTWFDDLNERLGGNNFSPASGHLLLAAVDHEKSRAIAYAVFSRVRKGGAAEITAWSGGSHGGFGRDFLRAIGALAFGALELKTLTAYVADDNAQSLRSAKHMGFAERARIPHYFGASAGILMTTDSESYRWAKEKHHGRT